MQTIQSNDVVDEIVFLGEIGDDDVQAAASDLLVADPIGDDFAHGNPQLAPQARRHPPNDVAGGRRQHPLGDPEILQRVVTQIVVHVEFFDGFGLAVGVEPRGNVVRAGPKPIPAFAKPRVVKQDHPLFGLPQVGEREIL